MKKILSFILISLISFTVYSAPPTRTDSYVSQTVIDPAAVTRNEVAMFTYLQAGVDKLANNTVTSAGIVDGTIVNADINSSAAIAQSKLSLDITNSDVNASAAIAGSKISPTFTSDVVIQGTTPSITIGDGGTEDTQINFDGNVKDFHIGLQDTTDDLTIGLGTTLGTTTHMNFTEDGEITKPLQPSFFARPSGTQSNITTGTDIAFATEIKDLGGDFSTPTFTAPVDGLYLFTYSLALTDWDIDWTNATTRIQTSNRNYDFRVDGRLLVQDGNWHIVYSTFADMDAGDTAKIVWLHSGGANQVDVSVDSQFSGSLIN